MVSSTLLCVSIHSLLSIFFKPLFFGKNLKRYILIIVQRDGTQSSLIIILQVHSTCLGCETHSSSGVHKTVTTASGTGRIFCAATSLQRGQASLATSYCWSELATVGVK